MSLLTAVAASRPLRLSSYRGWVVFLLALNLVCNLMDLATSYVALGQGLQEANGLAFGISAALDVGLFGSLVILKIFFVSFAVLVGLLGLRSRDPHTKRLLPKAIAGSTLFFFFISVNNLVWIIH